MSTFDSTKTQLSKLLDEIAEGRIQLPDFQRGWVWDDEHIRSLLVSIARSFPIGAVMLLETGGEAKFQMRLIEGIELSGDTGSLAEQLILDGQQRLTSLTQVLKSKKPVATRDEKKRELRVHYYVDIEKALEGAEALSEAIIMVDERRIVRTNFGRDIRLDLSTTDKEFAAFHFPCDQILNSDAWEEGLNGSYPDRFARYMTFRTSVLRPFRDYHIPVIALKKETSKEAVCLVFEKVNTGGVPLSVFELVTATWAAEGFNLRDDWFGPRNGKGRHHELARRALLKDVEPTDFLQGISLLHSWEKREADRTAGRTGKDVAAVTAKREHVLVLPLQAYRKWADRLKDGFFEAETFLRDQGFHHPKYLPYRSQIIPLAAVLAIVGERWLEPQIKAKIARWYWCGVLGELYGGAVETRIALDHQDLLGWIFDPSAPEPVTVQGAGFQPNRLDTLRSRTSAAYRGLYVLLQREGSKDFFWKARLVDLDRDERQIDIHHIFPRKWCEDIGIAPKVFNSIVNKTAISYKANRMIGGKAPSKYLAQLQQNVQVQLNDTSMDEILRSHLIAPAELREDRFEHFFQTRKSALLSLVSTAMGKALAPVYDEVPEDLEDDDDEEGDANGETRHEKFRRFWAQTIERSKTSTPLLSNRSTTPDHWISAGIGRAGFSLSLSLTEERARIECFIRVTREGIDKSKEAFHALQAQRQSIESAFGEVLDWQELPDRIGCRVCKDLQGGWRTPEGKWTELQDQMIATMVRLEKALKDPVHRLIF